MLFALLVLVSDAKCTLSKRDKKDKKSKSKVELISTFHVLYHDFYFLLWIGCTRGATCRECGGT